MLNCNTVQLSQLNLIPKVAKMQDCLTKSIKFDQNLEALYDEAIALNPGASVLKTHRDKISESVSESIYFLENAGFILES